MARKKANRRPAKAKPRRKASASRRTKPVRRAKRAKKPVRNTRRPAKVSSRKASGTKKRAAASPRKAGTRKSAPTRRSTRTARAIAAQPEVPPQGRSPRLDRDRKVLREEHGVPSSLDLDRHGSAVRTGREELEERRRVHATMTPRITGGDPDVDVGNAYFSGDEAPGGDNPTPDQDVVEEIGQALGIEYQDNEELQGGEEVAERDRQRWEFDPASSEDYRDRKNEE